MVDISSDIEGDGSLLWGPQPLSRKLTNPFTNYITDEYNLNPDMTPGPYKSLSNEEMNPWDPWEDTDEYGRTPERIQSDEAQQISLYGSTDPKDILKHNQEAVKYAGGDNVKYAKMKADLQAAKADLQAAWGTGLKGLSKGLLGLADTMGPETTQLHDYI
jgi:hypothetical protein